MIVNLRINGVRGKLDIYTEMVVEMSKTEEGLS